jgi:hypothetical protein
MIHAIAVVTVLATSTVGFADDLTGIKFSANEINNVWRFCSVSGRATSAILECFHAQTDKLAQAKDIERNNEHMEAITRQQVGVPAKPPE